MNGKAFQDFRVKSESRGEVVAIFARFDEIDKDSDVTLREAFTDGAEVLISSFGHGSWNGNLPVGKGNVRVTATDARLEGKFFLDTESGRDTFSVVKNLGELGQWSYGFDILDQAHGDFRGERVRFLKRLRVWEVSPVLVGAGRTATLSTKSAVQSTAVTAELRRLHEEFLRREVRCVKERFMARQARLEVAAARFRKLEETGYWYTDCSAPSAAHAKTAALMMELCAAELGIEAPLPVLVWFTPESAKAKAYVKQYGVRDWSSLGSEDPLWGAYRKNDHTVWISAGLPVGQAMEIVAHEMRHAAGGDEDEAQAYERAWSAKLPHPN